MTSPHGAVGRLVVCPTPIGNLEDVTLRALQELRDADAIVCEDTRRTRVLLARYEIVGELESLHEHNERERTARLAARVAAGQTLVLVSDAGTPLVSDPGYALVRACIEKGLRVEALPGASSVVTALVVSGLPCERWSFLGFLPRKRGELERALAGASDTLVAFESPGRLVATLELLASLDPERPVAVCRELSKLHEEVQRGSAERLAVHYRESPPRGEIVLVLGAASAEAGELRDALATLDELVRAGARARAAAGTLAKLTGVRANELYRAYVERVAASRQ